MCAELRQSVWHRQIATPRFAPLRESIEADVAVIGAGLTGLLTAARLTHAGKRVVVLDRARIASGASGATTAHITALLDTSYTAIASKFGREGAAIVAQSMTRAIDDLETLARSLGTPFERVAAYNFAHEESAVSELEEERKAATEAGLNVAFDTRIPFAGARPGGLVLQRQGELQPVALLTALAATLTVQGCRIFEDTAVTNVEDGEPTIVETPHGRVRARAVVMATHTPLGFSLLQTEVAPYRSYVLAARLAGPIPDGLFFDTAEPYNYARVVSPKEPDLVLFGGADHKTGKTGEDDCYARVEAYARDHFDVRTIEARWSSQYYEPADGLPYIGKLHGNTYVATGFSGDGLPFSAIAAKVNAELILGETSPESTLYAPKRIKPVAGAKKFFKENLDVAVRMVVDRLTQSDAASLSDIAPGEGRLVQLGTRKLAAYRSEAGELSVLSAACTHLGCVVHWNQSETSWDCPCHGGRFDVSGNPIDGPPVTPLERYASDTKAPKE